MSEIRESSGEIVDSSVDTPRTGQEYAVPPEVRDLDQLIDFLKGFHDTICNLVEEKRKLKKALVQVGEENTALKVENAELREALVNRKTIEKAKGILMKRNGLDEAGAFRLLQRTASSVSRKVIDVARDVVFFEELLSQHK